MRISIRPILIIQVIALILSGALFFTGCGTFRKDKYGDSGESLAAMKREMAAKSAAEALNEMDEELQKMADEGDIFEPGIQVKIPAIGIAVPMGANLTREEEYILGSVRTTLNKNFNRFARGYITVTNVNKAEQEELDAERQKSAVTSADDAGLSMTSRIAAQALMTGKITKIADKRFNLDFNISHTETEEILASYNENHSDIELFEGGIAVNKMTRSLLEGLGIRLNEAGKLALLGNSNEDATALAKGQAAAAAGRGLEAMNYLYNAENFDTTKQEAAGSLSAIQFQNREDLGAGAQITAYFEKQALWQGRLDEYNEFYQSHPPFELFYTPPTPVNMRGSGDSRAYDLSFKIGLRWSQNQIDVMERVLQEYILDGLNQNSPSDITGWELKGLPEDSELFKGPGNFNYNLVINVENERGEIIVSGPMVLSGSLYRYKDHIYADCTQEFAAAFSGIKFVQEQTTDQLYIRIANINGIDIKTVGENGFTRVVQTQGKELPSAQPNGLPREFMASKQKEIDNEARRERAELAAAAKQERENAIAAEKERKRQESLNNPLRKSRGGIFATGGLTLGAEETGIIDLGFFFGSNFWNIDLGLKFYPGSQTGHLTADYESSSSSSNEPSVGLLGIDAGFDFALVGRRWLLDAGGGATFFLAWASVEIDSASGGDSTTKDTGNDFFVIPYLRLCFDWRLVGILFLRAGYRMDVYPAEKFYTYFKSETKKAVSDLKFADNIFLGISLIY
ncbi:MAG: hypothetical protein LBB83_03825 [Treponema sp.]|nr:hypothetical protein [Treponema sp.]